MAWRHGEVWFDTDVLWFREQAGGEVAAALPGQGLFRLRPETMPVIRDGLAESRQRRAELRRRRNRTRTRAAALVLGPAVVLSLAAPKVSGGARAGGPLEEDPPSLTFRLGRSGPEISETPAPPDRTAEDAARAPAATPEPEDVVPEIHWHRATSHGIHWAGSLSDGTQLPLEGPDWVTWNPVEDSVPNAPRRLYGNEHTIRALVSVLAAYRNANPDAPRVVVGDISFRGGGPMELHRSHQNGLDVDVYYPRLDRALREPVTTGQVDRKLSQELLDRFLAAGARIVFVGYSTGLRGPSGVVVPYPNHENHMHVRFARPPA